MTAINGNATTGACLIIVEMCTFNYVIAMLTLYGVFYDYLVHFCFPSSVPFLCCGVKALGVFLGSDNESVAVAVFIDVLIQ